MSEQKKQDYIKYLEKEILNAEIGNFCPFCGNDPRPQKECKTCEIDHSGPNCLRDGEHGTSCVYYILISNEEVALADLVDRFSISMKLKLSKKLKLGIRGWDDKEKLDYIKEKMLDRARLLHSGDTSQAVDVANMAMMVWNLSSK